MDLFEKFYNSALRFLSYRPRSEKEIRDKLAATTSNAADAETQKVIDRVIQKLKEYKFVDDVEFAKKWLESRSRFKPQSLRFTKIELKRKGIDSELVDRIIHNSEFTIQNDLEQSKKLIEKKMTRFRNPLRSEASKFGMTKQEIYQKLGRFLAGKGFDWDTIKKSIDKTLGKGV